MEEFDSWLERNSSSLLESLSLSRERERETKKLKRVILKGVKRKAIKKDGHQKSRTKSGFRVSNNLLRPHEPFLIFFFSPSEFLSPSLWISLSLSLTNLLIFHPPLPHLFYFLMRIILWWNMLHLDCSVIHSKTIREGERMKKTEREGKKERERLNDGRKRRRNNGEDEEMKEGTREVLLTLFLSLPLP